MEFTEIFALVISSVYFVAVAFEFYKLASK